MRAFIKNYIAAEKARREEEGREAGFSLIELIVVVVILGILVAIAIPVFLGLQAQAQTNALKSAAANGATAAAAEFAKTGGTLAATQAAASAAASANSKDNITVALQGTPTSIDGVCVKASIDATTFQFAGPNAKADGTACK